MIGSYIVFLVIAAMLATYMTIVNRMLRSDEFWSESTPLQPVAATPPESTYDCRSVSPAGA